MSFVRPAEVIESDGGKEKVVPPQARPLLALLGFTGFRYVHVTRFPFDFLHIR